MNERELNKILNQFGCNFICNKNYSIEFKTMNAFKVFFEKEVSSFLSIRNLKYLDSFHNLSSTILEAIKSTYSANNSENVNNLLTTIKENIKQFLPFNHPIIQLLITLHEKNMYEFEGAWYYYSGHGIVPNNSDYFRGGMKLYLAEHTSEKLDLKDEFQSSRFFNLEEEIRNKFSNTESVYIQNNNTFESSLKEQNQMFLDTLTKIKDGYEAENLYWEDVFKETQKNYNEYCKLEVPSKQWEALEKKYEEEGKKWFNINLLVSGVALALIVLFLYYFPSWLKGAFTNDHLKGYFVLTIAISVFTFLIYNTQKLSTSSFHLARDARERLNLTHVYLALKKDENIDLNERLIILQSLFSRSDTGLIKNDGSPSMPGLPGIMESIIKNVKNN